MLRHSVYIKLQQFQWMMPIKSLPPYNFYFSVFIHIVRAVVSRFITDEKKFVSSFLYIIGSSDIFNSLNLNLSKTRFTTNFVKKRHLL